MLLHKSVVHDSRVRREAATLAAAGHDVVVLELARVDPEERVLDGFRRRSVAVSAQVQRALPFHAYRGAFLASFLRAVADERPDVVHAHDAAMLLPGRLGARRAGALLVYDSHELSTGVAWRTPGWARFVAGLERRALPHCAAVITVSEGIADVLQARYGLPERPTVLRNLPVDAGRPAPALRDVLGLGPGARLVLHNGSVAAGRGVEGLIDALADLPADTHLVLLGATGGLHLPVLQQRARAAGVADRVHALAPVAPEDVVSWSRGADAGVSLLADTCENHRLALPNKLFEYRAAGLPVVVSDLPELARHARDEGAGWPATPGDRTALARALRQALAYDGPLPPATVWADEAPRLVALYERVLAGAGQRRRRPAGSVA